MVICNTTISIDNSVKEEWVVWIKKVYIPLLMETGKFIDVRLFKVLNNQDKGGTSYASIFGLFHVMHQRVTFGLAFCFLTSTISLSSSIS